MAEPFLSEIRMVGFNFAPRGWAFCDGQTLPINQNQSLYSLLGTTFGGDGRTSFRLPDLRGRVPIHPGPAVQLGQQLGSEPAALSAVTFMGSTSVARGLANTPTYGQAHGGTAEGVPPTLAVHFCIAQTGLFPSRS